MSKITGIKPGKTREKRINIFLDGKLAICVLKETVLKEGLMVGQEVTESRLETLSATDQRQCCYNAAVRLLAYRPRSEKEIRERLQRRGFKNNTIEKAISQLKEQKLIDDIAFARFWKDNRQEFSPRSRRLTGMELARKGVSREAIEQATSELDDSENAYRAAAARARRLSLTDYQTFRRRLGSFLVRRGFGYEVIAQITERVWCENISSVKQN